ncbi:flagellin domain protein [Thiorhodococcus drewsii AZ1]|uniref:Flagellin n=1 Tax=Thiorhodococcus drewsii AZ1 TaxID=765913 RepID=G2E3T4_9GAMM|nr:flagellin domain protein [Thiorhodococcus drewsii AZ1]
MVSLSLNTNLSSLSNQNRISRNQAKLEQAIEQASSGLRINSAKDDAAGMEVSNGMSSTLAVSNALARNINDGISLTQVADSALKGIDGILQRARELAVQSNTGTLSANDRRILNYEFLHLASEVDSLAENTEIFGIYPLKGRVQPEPVETEPVKPPPAPEPDAGETPHISDQLANNGPWKNFSSGIVPIAYIPAGAVNVTIDIDDNGADDDIQIFTKDGKHLAGTPIATDSVWASHASTTPTDIESNVFLESHGFDTGATYDDTQLLDGTASFALTDPLPLQSTYNGMSIGYSGDGHSGGSLNERISIDQTTEPLLIMVVGTGAFDAKASWDAMPAPGTAPPTIPVTPEPTEPPPAAVDDEALKIVVEAHYGGTPTTIEVEKTPATTKDLELEDIEIDPFEKARKALEALNSAIDRIAEYRSQYGAIQERLDSALNSLYDTHEKLSTATSRIMDADYAQVTAELSRSNILMNANLAMQAQANKSPQLILELVQQLKP